MNEKNLMETTLHNDLFRVSWIPTEDQRSLFHKLLRNALSEAKPEPACNCPQFGCKVHTYQAKPEPLTLDGGESPPPNQWLDIPHFILHKPEPLPEVESILAEFDLKHTHPGDLFMSGDHNIYCPADALNDLVNSITAKLTAAHKAELAQAKEEGRRDALQSVPIKALTVAVGWLTTSITSCETSILLSCAEKIKPLIESARAAQAHNGETK